MIEINELMNVYHRHNLRFVSGNGSYLADSFGREYLDATSGLAGTSLGHSHPEITAAIAIQASRLLHISVEWQERLGEQLCRISQTERAFLYNSGAEAYEASLKLARLHGYRKGFLAPEVIVMDNSLHGSTLNKLSASDGSADNCCYTPLVPGFRRVPYGDIEAILSIANKDNQVTAVLMEPVQIERGIDIATPDYLRSVRELCNKKDWLFILDEVQTGFGRTGKWFAFQHAAIIPDVITVSKALGNGIPIGACLTRGDAGKYFLSGSDDSFLGVNPLACRVGCQVIQIIERDELLLNAYKGGVILADYLRSQMQDFDCVYSIRSHGMMAAIEFNRPCGELVDICASQERLLINVTRDKNVTLLPSLISTENDIAEIAHRLSKATTTWLRKK